MKVAAKISGAALGFLKPIDSLLLWATGIVHHDPTHRFAPPDSPNWGAGERGARIRKDM